MCVTVCVCVCVRWCLNGMGTEGVRNVGVSGNGVMCTTLCARQ